MSNTRITSSEKPRSTNPKWNENYFIFLEDPENEILRLEIEDKKSSKIISTMQFSILELLNERTMTIDRAFELVCMQTGYMPKITLKLTLKVFDLSVYGCS